MEWVLVYITLTFHGHPIAEEHGRFDSMVECFKAREYLSLELGSTDGYYPIGSQAVCVTNLKEMH
jgi:hypothetical protein